MPADDLKKTVQGFSGNRPLNKENIEDIAKIYSVSQDAVLYRLKKDKIITQEYYSGMRSEFSNKRDRKADFNGGNFYKTRISYLGKNYLKDVFDKYSSGKITIEQLGTLTRMRAVNLPSLASNMPKGD